MSILDKDLNIEVDIKDITSSFLSSIGFARKNTTRKTDRIYIRTKDGYQIVLSMNDWSQFGTLSISKIRRVHGKSRKSTIANKRCETVEQFIELINQYTNWHTCK